MICETDLTPKDLLQLEREKQGESATLRALSLGACVAMATLVADLMGMDPSTVSHDNATGQIQWSRKKLLFSMPLLNQGQEEMRVTAVRLDSTGGWTNSKTITIPAKMGSNDTLQAIETSLWPSIPATDLV